MIRRTISLRATVAEWADQAINTQGFGNFSSYIAELIRSDHFRVTKSVATKSPVSTRLDPETMERLERLAEVDRRSVSQIIETCVEKHLPRLESSLSLAARPANTAAGDDKPHN